MLLYNLKQLKVNQKNILQMKVTKHFQKLYI